MIAKNIDKVLFLIHGFKKLNTFKHIIDRIAHGLFMFNILAFQPDRSI
jgi:hypothetical protein